MCLQKCLENKSDCRMYTASQEFLFVNPLLPSGNNSYRLIKIIFLNKKDHGKSFL